MKNFVKTLNQLTLKINWLPPLFARITVGIVFIESGWGKIHNIEKLIGFFTSLGIPFPNFQAPVVAAVEFGAGIFLLAGVATRITSLPLIAIMTVAIVTAKAAEITTPTDLFGFSEFLYIALLIWLAVSGPGNISVDHFVFKKWRTQI